MLHIILGLCFLCIGIFGIVTNWWAVLDVIRVVIPVGVFVFGVVSILAGLSNLKESSK
jgi:hypothetical protein